MSNHTVRAIILSLTLAFAPMLPVLAADATSGGAEQARVEKAIQEYIAQQKADQEKANDQNVVNRTTSLINDPGTQILGNPQGDVTIVEFFDYTCPFCKAVEPRLRQLLRDDKNVRLVIKEFPILRPESITAAKAALASAKQGKYVAFHNAMMDFRGQLKNEDIFEMASDVGLNVDQLRKDMNAPEVADAIIANFNLARALRINQTPTFIIGNHLVTEASAKIDFPRAVADVRKK